MTVATFTPLDSKGSGFSPRFAGETDQTGDERNASPSGLKFFLLISLLLMGGVFFAGVNHVSASILHRPPNNLGLVGYWSMEDATGTKATDFSGQGNTGTLTGANGLPTWVTGKRGKALSFDGTDDYVDAGTSSSLDFGATSNFSIAFWAKSNKTDYSSALGQIIQRFITGVNTYPYTIRVRNDNNKVDFAIWDGTFSPVAQANNVIDLNWHHYVAIRNVTDDKLYLYVDGVLQGSGTTDTTTGTISSPTAPVRIGDHRVSGVEQDFFNGLIDDVRIYNRALGASEVTALYNQGQVRINAPNNNGLVGYWSMEDATGTKATDFSGQGNIGTLNNSPSWTTGKYGNALSFDGTSGRQVTAGNNASIATLATMSFSAWVYPKVNSGNQIVVRKNSNSGGSNSNLYQLDANSGTFRWLNAANASGVKVAGGNTSFSTNTWYHLVGTYDGATTRLYINGVQESTTGSLTGTIDTAPGAVSLKFGSDDSATPGALWNGYIDDVRIYNRALTAAEVTTLYNSGATRINSSQNTRFTNGLVGMWSFNGPDLNSTTAFDRSGQGNNGTLNGASGANNKPQPAIGKVGQALRFDGVDDYISDNLSYATLGSAFTISAWIKYDSSNAVSVPISIGPDLLVFTSLSNWRWQHDTGSITFISNNQTRTDKTWYHYVVTSTGTGAGNTKLYLNGTQSDDATAITTALSSGKAEFGRQQGGSVPNGRYFIGSLDDVRIYNRALSAAEVTTLYNSGATRINASAVGRGPQSGLIGHWTFDGPDLNTTTAFDRSGSTNTGTLVGASGANNKPQPILGKVGQALNFDGTDDYVTVNDSNSLDLTTEFTISAWGKDSKVFIAKNSPDTARAYIFSGEPGFKPAFTIRTVIDINDTGPLNIPAGRWFLITITHIGTSYSFYIDGVLNSTITNTNNPSVLTTNLLIGYYGAFSLFTNGPIDDVRIYNRALSAAEVLQLYNLGK